MGTRERMKVKTTQCLAAIVLALGCATATAGGSRVVQTGPDTYILASHGVKGWSSSSTQKVKAIERASEYCKNLGKQMELVSATENAGGWAKQASADVEFRCVAAAK
jgi:hypothetical protein